MATAVSIAIRKADAQARIQKASVTLAAKYGLDAGDLAPHHKQPEIQTLLTLEAIAAFLEGIASFTVAIPSKTPPPEPPPAKSAKSKG